MTHVVIVDGQGMGGFLAPPGDPTHRYAVREMSSNRRNAREIGSYALDSATRADWLPGHVRTRVAEIINGAERVESERWVRYVYGYFRGMWTRDGRPWSDVSTLVSGRPDGAPDDWHAAVVWVRRYFPDHAVRADLIFDPGTGYGSHPCRKCGERVQYEARYDALAKVTTRLTGSGITEWSYGVECPRGGQHDN